MLLNLVKATLAVTALTWAMSGDARASFTIFLNDGTTGTSIGDGDALDKNNSALAIKLINLAVGAYTVNIDASSTDPTSATSPMITQNVVVKLNSNVSNPLTVKIVSTGFSFADTSTTVNTSMSANLLRTDASVNGNSALDLLSTDTLNLNDKVANPTVSNSQILPTSATISNTMVFSLVFTAANNNDANVTLTTTFGAAAPVAATPAPATLLAMGTLLPFLGMAFRRRTPLSLATVRA